MFRVHLFLGKDSQWYWNVKSSNGEVVCQSEGYKRKSDAKHIVTKLFLSNAICILIEDK